MTAESARRGGNRNWFVAGAVAAVLMLVGTACTPQPEASGDSAKPSPAATESATPTATPTPTPPPLSLDAMDGFWRATTEDGNSFAVRGDLVAYTSGHRARVLTDGGQAGFVSVIADGAKSCDDAEGSACSPLGQLVPTGTAVKIPDYAEGVTDDPTVDRIWDGQGGVLYVREALPTAESFPEQLRGEWCAADGSMCFSLDDLLEEQPLAFIGSFADTTNVPGAVDYQLCLAADLGPQHCSMAASMSLRYFAAGAEWDCNEYAKKAEYGNFTTCDPATVVEHDSSKERLIRMPNHQQDDRYIDSMPMYRR